MKRLASGLLSLSGLLAGCDASHPQTGIPPIDTATPKTVATATFALG